MATGTLAWEKLRGKEFRKFDLDICSRKMFWRTSGNSIYIYIYIYTRCRTEGSGSVEANCVNNARICYYNYEASWLVSVS